MTEPDDIKYFQERALAEWALSRSADNPAAALIHSNLAKRYERLAGAETTRRQTLSIVSAPGPAVSAQTET